MKIAITTLLTSIIILSAIAEPIMIMPGKTIVSLNFDKHSDLDKKWIKTRKETVLKVERGLLHAIPPLLVKKESGKETKWGDSNFARAGLIGLPQEYVCQARWKYIKPADSKTLSKGLVYIDLGHRMIRATMTRDGTTLLLENHLIGRQDKKPAIVLQKSKDLKLEHGKWYDITAEVKGDEVVLQINGHVLYGKHPLIAEERYDTFNFDAIGDGFLVDSLVVRAAGNYQADWNKRKKSL